MDVLAVLQRLGSGRLLVELEEALVKTSEEVVAVGNPGSVTLKLKLSNQEAGDVSVVIGGAVGRTSPATPTRAAFFFSVDGGLHKEDPRQPELPEMRTMVRETGEIREPGGRENVREIR